MQQQDFLHLDRCPQCNIARPRLSKSYHSFTATHSGKNPRCWAVYLCDTCGGAILTMAKGKALGEVVKYWPQTDNVHETVPDRAREFLSQAIASIHSPAGAVMLTASAVDAMLKEKGYKDGNLNSRINKAASEHLITAEMAEWAHEIRLDANDQRHSDDNAPLPDEADAQKVIEFALALGQFLFVLPARVARGRMNALTNGP